MKLEKLFGIAALVAIGLTTSACSGTDATPAPSADPAEDDLNAKGRFSVLKKPTDPDLAALYTAGKGFDGAYLGVYRFNKPTTEGTDAGAREKRIKEVMHRYMCGFFDESIDIGESKTSKEILGDLDMDNNAGDKDQKALTSALDAVLKNKSLDTLSGSASGNNTMGEIMGVYDEKHHEVLYFGFTNCGSDD